MSSHPILFAFALAVVTFYINHRIKRAIEIKVLINTLFDIFGNEKSLGENDPLEVAHILMNEIISLEKLHDGNGFVEKEISKIRSLRNLWFRLGKGSIDENEFKTKLGEIPYRKLGIAFLLLVFFNPET